MSIPLAVASLVEGDPSLQWGHGFRIIQGRRRWTPARERRSVTLGSIRMHSRGLVELTKVILHSVSLRDAARKSQTDVKRVRKLYDLMLAQGQALACPCGRALDHRGLCLVRFPQHRQTHDRWACSRCRVRGHNARTCPLMLRVAKER